KEMTSLLETAEASLRVGLISKQDLENIKKEIAQKQAEAEQQSTEKSGSEKDEQNKDENKEN
ncbi:MAG: hypothetical protein ACLRFE_02420, partial [Clostridia bacterium]